MKECVGSHNDRKVFVENFTNYDGMNPNFSGELCLIFAKKELAKGDFEKLVSAMVGGGVLGVWVAGVNVDRNFDRLLDNISTLHPQGHIMTGIIPESDGAVGWFNFLIAGLPDGERWNEWNAYRILILSQEESAELEKDAEIEVLRKWLLLEKQEDQRSDHDPE